MTPLVFGRSVNPEGTKQYSLVNPIPIRAADYAHHITTIPPDFWTVRRVCKRNFLKIINLYRVNAPTSWESSISTENSTISTVNATQCDPGAGKSIFLFIVFSFNN